MIPLDDFVTSQFFQKLARHKADEPKFCPGDVKAGDIVYSRVWRQFMETDHPHIEAPYILITNFHDRPIDHIPAGVEDETLLHWFGVNMAVRHPKMTPIPLALDERKLPLMRKNFQSRERTYDLYLNCTARTPERRELYEIAGRTPQCVAVAHDKRAPATYYRDLSNSNYVLCPKGGGEDTYRIWETIAAGAIPVVKRSFLCNLLQWVDCVVVDEWEQITRRNPGARFWAPENKICSQAYWRKVILGK